ncbi:MAG: peptidylprolyl isomerase [Casimicrobiaceae bacterium]
MNAHALNSLAFRALFALAATTLSFAPAVAAAPAADGDTSAADTILLRRGNVTLTRGDWDAEVLRIPAKDRADFAESPRRNRQLLERMMTTRELAARAREQKLDQDPMTRLRVRQEEDRVLAAVLTANVEEGAAIEFELKRPAWERRARELYEVDKPKYSTPETVTVTMLFFSATKDSFDGAQARATEALARIKGGADIGELALTLSDDATTRELRGRKGPVSRADLDPSLANAVFALTSKGALSQPIRTRDGWFVVRLDERQAPKPRSFDEVKGEILAQFKESSINAAREAMSATLGEGKQLEVNQPAIDALRTPPRQRP